ncbi:P-loop containing nucleoside triphosphate hydrolase protein [Mycena rosella]|uniref:Kinesin-like protein n=1 Tax=Mycena rosella TaxID=1033263 RepID=A0AAD7GJE4_MYCRO|nr:P-loop containing nucleoside triphosphate hydrolase protein [Mycena rosella]
MSSTKPKVPTRASTRTKTPTAVPPTTRTTRAAASKPVATTTTPPLPATKKSTRKPLVSKDNATEVAVAPTKPASKSNVTRKIPRSDEDADREPIMAYLRIRPHLGEDEPSSAPYLSPLSDTSVRMTDPHDPHSNPSRFRVSTIAPSSIYTFSHIFPTQTSQSEFFTKTTLPLVRDVLQGQNGLLFAYGVTNSGKTYTVQGGAHAGSAGILPRSLDVLFNSIEGLHGTGKYRPVRLQGVELADKTDSAPPPVAPEPALAEVLGQHMDPSASDTDIDPTVLKVDRNYEYTIWLSYAEVYNEKVYDLLDNVQDNSTGGIPRSNSGKSLLLTRKALSLKPSPVSDSPDAGINGKYISGLRQFRVHSASQAKALVKLGQLHRRVFGTLANRESSRSHGMVILKVVRGHRGERDDPTALQIARLTLVDLAGSERTKHTQTTGDRLKEAGNINKSLMVLGQCMEVLRSNQRKVAVSLAQDGLDGRMDTREVKRGLAVVPFRHSKLTEALMDYFVGDARAVMIVNVNPYDTGYDENSHVMKFAALAREVYVTPAPAPVQRLPVAAGKAQGTTKRATPDAPKPYRRKVTISTGGPGSGRKASEAVLEVLEVDEGDAAESDDDEPINPLVDALFDEVEELRMQLFESEMRCAIIEADVREEVMREMELRMASMEKMYARRLMNEVQQNEMKTDAKIDMLHQSGLFGSPVKRPKPPSAAASDISEEEEDDVETSLVDDLTSEDESEQGRSLSLSPLAGKGKAQARSPAKQETPRAYIPDPPMLPSDSEDAELTESELESEDGAEGEGDAASVGISATTGSEAESDGEYTGTEDEEEEDWAPAAAKTPRAKPTPQRVASPSPASRAQPRVSKLERGMSHLTLGGGGDPDDSVIILPVKKFRARQESSEYEDQAEPGIVKKKKRCVLHPIPVFLRLTLPVGRQLAKKTVVTEEQIERAAAKQDSSKNVRRMTGRL